MESQVSELIKMLSAFYPVPIDAQDFLCANSKLRVVKRGEFLLMPGEICENYYFIW